jgi:hypothetical protein
MKPDKGNKEMRKRKRTKKKEAEEMLLDEADC